MCVYVWIRVYVVVLLGRSLRFLCCAICRRVGLLGSSFQNVLLFVDWCTPSGMVGGLGFVVGFLWREGGGWFWSNSVLVGFGVGLVFVGRCRCRSVLVSVGLVAVGYGAFGAHAAAFPVFSGGVILFGGGLFVISVAGISIWWWLFSELSRLFLWFHWYLFVVLSAALFANVRARVRKCSRSL